MRKASSIYGVMAEFDSPEDLLGGAEQAYAAGYREMDAYTPFPIEGLAEALGVRHTRLPVIVFFAGILGGLAGYGLQYFTSVIDYPLNVGGRPFHSWPSFVPVTFELTVLLAAAATVFGMMALNGLPRPHHPVFNAPNFELATRDRFFLCIESGDPGFEVAETRRFLEGLNPSKVSEVEQ